MTVSYDDMLSRRRDEEEEPRGSPTFEEMERRRQEREDYGLWDVARGGVQSAGGRLDRTMAGIMQKPEAYEPSMIEKIMSFMPGQAGAPVIGKQIAGKLSESGALDWMDRPREHFERAAEGMEEQAAEVPPRNLGEHAAALGAGLPLDILNVLGLSKLTRTPASMRWPAGIGMQRTFEGIGSGEDPEEAIRAGAKHGAGMLAFPALGGLRAGARGPILAGIGGKIATSEGEDPYQTALMYGVGGLLPTRERGKRSRDLLPQSSAAEAGRISMQEIERGARLGLGAEETLLRPLTKGERTAIVEAPGKWSKQEKADLREAQSRIGALPDSRPEHWGDITRINVADDLHGLLRADRQVFGRQMPNGLYETARKLRAVPNIAEGLVNWGAPKLNADGSMEWIGEPLKNIFRQVAITPKDLKRFKLYITGKQAEELLAQGRERLFEKRHVKAMVKLETPAFKDAFGRLQGFQKNMLDFYESSGLINAEQRAKFQRTMYATAMLRERGKKATRGMGDVLGGEAGIHTLRGSMKNLKDPLHSLIEGPSRMVQLAMENRARLKAADMAKAPGGDQFLKPKDPGSKLIKIGVENLEETMRKDLKKAIRKVYGEERSTGILRRPTKTRAGPFEGSTKETMEGVLERELRRAGQEVDDIMETPGMLEVLNYYKGGVKPFGDDIMTVFRNGKREYYEVVDEMFLESLNAFRRPEMTGVTSFLNSTRRLVQASVTLDPTFWARNSSRDLAMSSIMTRTGFQSVTETARAYWDVIRRSPEYRDFVLNGGGGASFYDGGASLRRTLVKHAQRRGFNPRGLVVTPGDVYRLLDRIGRMGEEAPRLGEFKRAKRRGMGAERGGFLAREITTDFSMTGLHTGFGVQTGVGAIDTALRGASQTLGFLTKTVPFMNAMIAGGDRLYRGVVRDPSKRGVTAAKMATVTMMGTALHLWNSQNPAYQRLPDWDKWTYWHFFLDGENEEEHWKMPKLWEVGSMSSIMERTMESAIGTPDPDQKLWQDVGRIIMMNFGFQAPVGAQQILEQARGKRSFTGEHMEPMSIAGRERWARYKPTTSETFKALGRATKDNVQIPPSRAEALYRGMFNAWADHSLHLMDDVFFPGKAPAKYRDQQMVIKAFKERPGKYNRYVSKFYDLNSEMSQIYKTVADFEDSEDDTEAALAKEIMADPHKREMYWLYKTEGRQAEKYIREERKAMKALRKDPTLSATEKRDRLDKLRRQLDSYMEERWKTWAKDAYE